jgi:uncharacterized protein YcbK (DUF882 family)
MYSVPKNMRIATNFLLSEFACKDGSKTVIVDFELLFLLQCLRDVVGRVIVTSAYRTPEYNKKVGGIANSFHLDGKAADIKVPGLTPYEVAIIADRIGFLGVGVYPTFTHVDVGGDGKGGKLYWKQDKSGKKTLIKSLNEARS